MQSCIEQPAWHDAKALQDGSGPVPISLRRFEHYRGR